MAGLYLQVKQIQRRSILCILLTLNQFMWTECSNDSCIFFCWKTYCSYTGWVPTNFIEVKVSKVFVQMVILRCIWINRAEQALKHFQLCSQAVKCKCISLYWGTNDRSGKKDGKSCQIFWHRFHGRADILRKKDSVMKLKRRRRILLKSIIISGWIWGGEGEICRRVKSCCWLKCISSNYLSLESGGRFFWDTTTNFTCTDSLGCHQQLCFQILYLFVSSSTTSFFEPPP